MSQSLDLQTSQTQPKLEQVQSFWSGALGAVVLVAGVLYLAFRDFGRGEAAGFSREHAWVLAAMFAAIAAYEILVVKVYRRQFDFSRRVGLGSEHYRRIGVRFFGFVGSMGIALGLYVVLAEYHLDIGGPGWFEYGDSWYGPFFVFFRGIGLAGLAGALPYFYLCEKYGCWPWAEDDMLVVAQGYWALVRGRWPLKGFWQVWRGFLVKFFFLPLMVVFFVNNAVSFEKALFAFLGSEQAWGQGPAAWMGLAYEVAYEGIFLLDVAFTVLGYSCTLRLFDAQVRSAEPTLLGWAVALACYPPLNSFANHYIPYNEAGHYWGPAFASYPLLYGAVGGTIVLLLGIYVLATVAFGLRFSNLTHRGIISRGPYRFVRHPAYAAKCLSWWLVSIPFLYDFGDCLRLLLWNLIYVARALTEERHLKKDPLYRQYMGRVKYRFIPGLF